MQIPSKAYSESSLNYRYGFNGKENDNEISGQGNTIDFGNRIDDVRLGRWLSTDRVSKPWLSPYQFSANNPVNNVDPDGKDEIHFHFYTESVVGSDGKTSMGKSHARIEIVKANGPDRFFHHQHHTEIRMPTNYSNGGASTHERTREFYPWHPDSRSGLSTTTLLGLYERTDRDYTTLMKYASANPALKVKLAERSVDCLASEYDRAKYKALLAEMPYYDAARKTQQVAEFGVAVLSVVEGGLGLGGALGGATLPSRLVRVIPEKYATGAETIGGPGAMDAFVADASQLKGLTTSEQIAQKLTLVDEGGNLIRGPFRLIEFDAPMQGLAQPFNRTNPGFINGGKTAGGATEYVLPNLKISELKNVTQKTIQ
jgi:RHS repeat-associated protein